MLVETGKNTFCLSLDTGKQSGTFRPLTLIPRILKVLKSLRAIKKYKIEREEQEKEDKQGKKLIPLVHWTSKFRVWLSES